MTHFTEDESKMIKKVFNLVQKKVHAAAKDKGWYDAPIKTDLEAMMLMVSEISEAAEEVRLGKDPMYTKDGKPEGVTVELADVLLRIFDYCGYKGYDLGATMLIKHNYNHSRPYRHGKKL